ncbi:protein phosphatase 2C domain-containing protein [uncultured Paludibaculum sp.]|uniref:PP2C family protein-serine/threonine phosphatase n=1 Tax=uncultured Paludibaculum sp. TaxID=1765020 RepID=UPI002AAC2EEE|nr:protein phosphatase 2C domain-containing protein [uncultured Paludibaculum sp.]
MRSYIGISDVGCVRKNNEDSYLVDPELGLYAVADGMGGAQAGELASQIAIQSLREAVAAAPVRTNDALIQAFEHANTTVLETAAADPRLEGMGTTMICALETPNALLVGSVGDSRAWLYQDGRLALVSNDQTWVNEVGRPLGIAEERLKVHPMRHVLTMAVGVSQLLRVQVYPLHPPVGSILLLSSDGLHGPLDDENLEKIMSQPISLEARAHSFIEAAKKAGGPDNITVVLLEF